MKNENAGIKRLPEILVDGRLNGDIQAAAYQKQIQDLYAAIGELTTKLNWLKKIRHKIGVGAKGSILSNPHAPLWGTNYHENW
ncbi:MAG: hypothetical protein WA131_01800 [Desulfitobacteriaceae bacterium]